MGAHRLPVNIRSDTRTLRPDGVDVSRRRALSGRASGHCVRINAAEYMTAGWGG